MYRTLSFLPRKLVLASTLLVSLTLAVTADSREAIAADMPPELDLLVVMDNSSNMGDFQMQLAFTLDNFLGDLTMDGVLPIPSLHIGIVSADLGVGSYTVEGCTERGDDGLMRNEICPFPFCASIPAPANRYLIDEALPDGSRKTNYSGALSDVFRCIAMLSHEGCKYEQHLEAMKRALDGTHPEHDGFLRPDAYLAVLFVANQDDCSAYNPAVFDPAEEVQTTLGPPTTFRCAEFGIQCGSPSKPIDRLPSGYLLCEPREGSPFLRHPNEYLDFLSTIKPLNKVFVAVQTGVAEQVNVHLVLDDPLCPDEPEQCPKHPELADYCETSPAKPGVRLAYLHEQLPRQSTLESICGGFGLDKLGEPLKDFMAQGGVTPDAAPVIVDAAPTIVDAAPADAPIPDSALPPDAPVDAGVSPDGKASADATPVRADGTPVDSRPIDGALASDGPAPDSPRIDASGGASDGGGCGCSVGHRSRALTRAAALLPLVLGAAVMLLAASVRRSRFSRRSRRPQGDR
ncbi:MAG: hypothetical protein V2A73_15325 [Pseudomonadota bacterium]